MVTTFPSNAAHPAERLVVGDVSTDHLRREQRHYRRTHRGPHTATVYLYRRRPTLRHLYRFGLAASSILLVLRRLATLCSLLLWSAVNA